MNPPNFRIRTYTALLFVVIMVGTILLGVNYFAGLMFGVSLLGMAEFYKLFVPYPPLASRLTGKLAGALLFVLIFAFNSGWISSQWFWAAPLILMLPFLSAMFDYRSQAISAIGVSLAGITFIAIPLSLLPSIFILGERFETVTGTRLILMILIILWIYDTVAYILGSVFGRHPLYKRLSPGKTWEGSLGGLVFGLATAFVISGYYPAIHLFHWLALAIIIIVFGTLGDLCESMLKRNAGVKDSGSLLPGHGGILDRFDALFFTAPAIYFYIIIVVNKT